MSLFWGRYCGWEPQGGERREWKDLTSGDLIEIDRKVWRIIEVRQVPVIDWDDDDREYWDRTFGDAVDPVAIRRKRPESEEAWDRRPLNLILVPVAGGKRHHLRVRPYAIRRDTYVLSPHYPVCRDCGEPWPCRELEITAEVGREAVKLAKLEKILPGCCWSCGEPVTRKQASVGFDGENLLLPGAPPPVFHLRRKGQCRFAAQSYEKRWVAAVEGRRWRLQCPGSQIRHVDGDECTEDPYCPGPVSHNTFMRHSFGRLPDGTVQSVYGPDFRCLRCEDVLERRGLTLGEPPPGALLLSPPSSPVTPETSHSQTTCSLPADPGAGSQGRLSAGDRRSPTGRLK